MRPLHTNNPPPRDEPFDRSRQRMLDETSRFIEWGLANPDKVEWIPKHPVGRGQFSDRLKNVFWSLILHNPNLPD
ncbi:MAG TPA: hypothetical protein VM008_09135 [Phycisphaerae bacterium]|nr:hypothetical protein [Phycisphaerae bacterium]